MSMPEVVKAPPQSASSSESDSPVVVTTFREFCNTKFSVSAK
jgi:hypothetical protein